MMLLGRFRSVNDNSKSYMVRTLIESSTPDFDFFYFVTLATVMATLGLIGGSATIVIGSMLIAPILFPILSAALGLIMGDMILLKRSTITLLKAFVISLVIAIIIANIAGTHHPFNTEILLRTEPNVISAAVAIVAGLAVAFALSRPELNAALPGVAVAASLIPPIGVMGIGIAHVRMDIALGACALLLMNVIGIIFATMLTFSLMDFSTKRELAQSILTRESKRILEEDDRAREWGRREGE